MRLLRLAAGLVAGMLVLVLGVVLIAPDTVARVLAGRAAAWSGIPVQGTDTIDVSLTEARISGGPLSFGGGSGRPGHVGQFRADLDGRRLFAGELVFEDLFVADADLALTIGENGRATLNGIPLDGSPGDGAQEEAAPGDQAGGLPAVAIRQANLERLRLEISRGPGRSLPILLEHARLAHLSPETPDVAATFEFAGVAGRDARFAYRGEAKPFGQPMDVVLDGGFENLSLAEVETVAGPLGLRRFEGRLGAEGRHHLTLSRPESLEVTSLGAVTASGIDVALPGSTAIRLDRAHLELDARTLAQADGRVEFANRAPWEVAGLVVAWSDTGAVKVAEATLDLDVAASMTEEAGVAAKIRGSVPLRGHAVAWSDTGDVHLDQATARVDIDVTAAPDGAMKIAGPMAIDGGSGGIRSGDSFRLSYQGIGADFPDARIDLAPDGTALVEGRPEARFSGFALAAPVALEAAVAVATSKSLRVVSPAEGVLVEFHGGLALEDVAAPVNDDRRLRAQTTAFDLDAMRYDEEPSAAARLTSGIGMRAGGIRMEGKDAPPFPVRDGTVTLAGLDLALTAEGGVRRLALAPETGAVLEGEARGRPHHLTLGLDRLEITDLDPAVPDQLTQADIVLTVNERGRIELSERVKPFARPPEFVFDGSIRDLELPELSPYLAALIGLNAESGRFAAIGRATAENAKLKGVVDLDIQTLDLVAAAKKGRDPVVDLAGVPVDLAIALLENADRRIDVSLPFSGDLSSIEVDYCDVIRTALLGAVRLAVTGPLQGGKPGDTAAAGLGPVPFAPGSSLLSPEATRQVERIGGLLAKKPRLRLQVCGRATAADARALAGAPPGGGEAKPGDPAVSTRLVALAQERSRVALAGLTGVAGVEPDQVQECRPVADAADAGPPGADTRF